MLALGQRCVTSISDIAFGGEGVGRVGELVVFVPFVALGEEVEIEITALKKQYARGRLVSILKGSPVRVSPQCPYFGECGGCQYQHIEYASQLAIKHKQLTDVLQRIGGLTGATVKPVMPCPRAYGYRNRIMIRSQWDKVRRRLSIGFIRTDNRLLVDVEECAIAEPAISARIQEVRSQPPPKGGIKVVLRMPPEGWDVPPTSFFQNNFHILPAMIEALAGILTSSGARYLLDLYCGVGFMGISLGAHVESFVGVELDRLAVEAARRNALARGQTNGEFLVARAESCLRQLLERFGSEQTAVVLDPPRKGCPRRIIEELRALRPAQIIYVSCHPATLARDLNVLSANGVYQVRELVPLDMFPQTQHVECIADLRTSANDPTGSSAGMVADGLIATN